ncbi:MAG: prolipoprotein diacylglyceryl transferase [Bacteroidetes bacterium]|nr:prolipoprotein diacylglyceryl transferase [Bacteroidota bacterium]MBU1115710.1 prolipoprotein diacylglyceryl transferase [Bacteroidota bacterium]MBU1799933.1 prolipoprotein diacylglyceryl transferase [Bacteroidota bacterium]
MFATITWSISPEIFSLGPIHIRWYGLLFASSFIVGFKIMERIFIKENKPMDDLNDLVWFMILGTVLGARLGHCLFYNPEYYLSNPLEILKVWKGGLASHGAAIGILTSIYFYSKKKKNQSFLWVMDRVVITVALAAFFIRMGNLFNSEIIGYPTDLPWGFIFTSVDNIPRHPAQLYEALFYLLSFAIIYYQYKKHDGKFKDGYLFGIFLILIFGFRIFVEFFKENQTYFEEGMILNMGQILSFPLVIAGIYFLYNSKKGSKIDN